MSVSALPEELLHRILSYHFHRSIDAFCGDPTEDTGRNFIRLKSTDPSRLPVQPPSNALLVSKRWLRIGTPLLYRFLSLSTTQHTQSVAALLRANPSLGRTIRHVRVRGGCGKDLKVVLGATQNIESLSITLDNMKAKDSIVGLRSILPMLNPSALYLSLSWRSTKNLQEVSNALVSAISKEWTSLKRLHFVGHAWAPGELLTAMSSSPALEEISLHYSTVDAWLLSGHVTTIFENKRIRRLLSRGAHSVRARELACKIGSVPSHVVASLTQVENTQPDD